MCLACNEVEIPEWSLQEKREFIASFENIEPESVPDELIYEYDPLIGLGQVMSVYGVLAVPQEYIDQHCCRGKPQ